MSAESVDRKAAAAKRDVERAAELCAYLLEASDPMQPASRRCFRFVLVHLVGESESAQCERVFADDLEGLDRLGADRERQAGLFARAFTRAARELTDMKARRQGFALAAYTTIDEDKPPKDRCLFSVDPTDKPEDTVDGEDAREQIQRIADTSIKEMARLAARAISAHEAVVDQWKTYATTVQGRNNSVEDRQVSLFTGYQAALDNQALRNVQADRSAFYLSMQKEGWDAFKLALPVLLDRVGRGPASNLLRSMAGDPDKVEAFLLTAKPHERALLHQAIVTYMPELLEEILERRREREAVTVKAERKETIQ